MYNSEAQEPNALSHIDYDFHNDRLVLQLKTACNITSPYC